MRCQWCGNPNPIGATECASCGKDLIAEQTVRESVEVLEDIQVPEGEVVCPECGASNFIGSKFCDLCGTPLHPGVFWPMRKAGGPPPRALHTPLGVKILVGAYIFGIATFVVIVMGTIVSLMTSPFTMNRDGVKQASYTSPPYTVQKPMTSLSGDADEMPETAPHIDVDGQRGAMKANPNPFGSYPSAPAQTTAKPFSGRIVLPIAAGSVQLHRTSQVNGALKSGRYVYQLPGTVYDGIRIWDSPQIYKTLSSQGLRMWTGSYSYSSGGTKEDANSATQNLRVSGRPDCSVTLSWKPLRTQAPKATQLTVDYVIPAAWTLSFR